MIASHSMRHATERWNFRKLMERGMKPAVELPDERDTSLVHRLVAQVLPVLIAVLFIAGCRSEADRLVDQLRQQKVIARQNSAGDIIEIDAGEAGLTPELRLALKGLRELRSLHLSGSEIEAADLTVILTLQRLETLDLSYTNVTSKGLVMLARLPSLRSLAVNGVRLGDSSGTVLSQLAGLRTLSVMETDLSDEQISELERRLPACLIVR